MKVTVAGDKVFVYGDLHNETLELEMEKDVEFYMVGCDITFKNSFAVRLYNWIIGKKTPTVAVDIERLKRCIKENSANAPIRI